MESFDFLFASFAALGVLGGPGVRFPNAPWAVPGVILTKSAKFKTCPGVVKHDN